MAGSRLLILVASIPLSFAWGFAQTPGGRTSSVDYKPGQVWQYSGGQEVITVLKVDEVHKFGRVVHVRIDNVPATSCQGIVLTTSIEHLALTEKMMRKSSLRLVRDDAELPDAYFSAYQEWQKQKKPDVQKNRTVEDVISRTPQIGAICNFLPQKAS